MSEQQVNKVTKANDLIEASYRLTLNEQRLVLSAVALVNSVDAKAGWSLRDGRVMRITALGFADIYGIDVNTAYEALQDAAERLYDRTIRRKGAGVQEEFRWISRRAVYQKGDGAVEISWSPEILPYLTLLGKKFTSYELRQIVGLTSVHAIRLYELLKQFESTGERIIKVADFRECLGLTDTYDRFSSLKKRVIEPSVRAINLHSDLAVEWDGIKKGRAVDRLHFSFEQKKQGQLAL